MQAKTINKNCAKKMDNLLKSLPKKLAEKVKPNIIITGGAIVSMLQGDPINDWDIYIKDRNVLKDLVEYYLNKFNKSPNRKGKTPYTLFCKENATENDYNRNDYYSYLLETDNDRLYVEIPSSGIVAECDKKAINAMDSEDKTTHNSGLSELDVEKFPEKTKEQRQYKKEMKDYIKTKYRPIFLTGNALTLSHKVQLIVRFFGTPEEIHKNFDFRAVKSYWTYETGLKTNVDILLDINSKKLVYEGSRYPICSLIRTRKYVSRQWKISAGEFVKMAFQVGDLDLKNIDVLKDQLVGVDSTYFTWMINIIEKDLKNAHKNGTEFDIDSDYICNVIDFVFNR
jgi:hypothetical protein